ncbi:hypothetical protein PMAYCL1PPCAC_29740 [Pristionchus mayeri]|uniref:Aminopeptidase N-like N-terminal domain-containing protein n=1 Tax=Pristionchus mayeri TaxID=1317129 RepID=A0AAN5DCE4_9BILA|nr:hypothetical protein PMAYCL1PPCAC_29740 [Pristionchus mayeri]
MTKSRDKINSETCRDGRYPSSTVHLLSTLILISVIFLLLFFISPRIFFNSVDEQMYGESHSPSIPDPPIDPLTESFDPRPPIGHQNKSEAKGEDETEGNETKPSEDFDVDDLPFSRGMNPIRQRRKEVLHRLSKFIDPLHYSVHLNVTVRGRAGANESTVEGLSSIFFRIDGDPSNLLEIHIEGFRTLKLISLKNTNGLLVRPISEHYNKVKRTVVWMLERPMKTGEEYEMMVMWRMGASSKGFMGLYETWESLPNGERAYQLVTQGEVMGTRKWMPCFDEPSKASLSLSINHPFEMNARSNGAVKSRKNSSLPGIHEDYSNLTISVRMEYH